ncbi:sarcosine oxidase subunit gamma [Aquicoccus porphyridii]|uniref:Sarcosine oxidase subunit gamma n=1 Tax=Aquicoccus porphyridii TaxID=1852029 RepID=A0A5A9ZHW1_9RHOB|nr:sarcosine oxidase subunit gamma family protein [Aquicoccus porphyridii]KAA0916615.1 sarcosine oxidase subunit gamma [Aquicoccus porphyridii]RAI53748.1 sarcosine oxidase subunit gamma [Rhodobacteraceae bacterium AsT-22]
MSEAKTALPGALFDGIAVIEEAGLQGMITLRGDLGDKALASALHDVTGCALPGPREVALAGEKGAAWMSPDELLVMVPHGETAAAVATLDARLGERHALAADVSDARVVFDIRGAYAREVLGKLMPVDFSADAFGPGQIRRSRMAQVPAAVWMTGEDAFRVVCFRSVAQYVFDLLKTAASEGGEVGLYA